MIHTNYVYSRSQWLSAVVILIITVLSPSFSKDQKNHQIPGSETEITQVALVDSEQTLWDSYSGVPSQSSGASSSADQKVDNSNGPTINKNSPAAFNVSLMSSLKKKNPLDESFSAKVPFLWSDKDPAGDMYPGKGIISKPENASYQLFNKILIKPQVENYFKTGDTLDIFASLRFIQNDEQTFNVIKRVGRCKVVESAPLKVVAILIEQWDVITGKERVDKSVPFKKLNIDSVFTPQTSVSGSVITRAEETPGPYPFQTVIIDKGTKQGVETGDIFAIYHLTDKKGSSRLVSVSISTHVNLSSSSLTLLTLFNSSLEPGDKVVLVRKVHFSSE